MLKRTGQLIFVAAAVVVVGCSGDEERQPVNASCSTNNDCADHVCHSGVCAAADPVGEGKPCQGNGQCKSYNCRGGVCRQGITAEGKECLRDEECLHGHCSKHYGVCGGKGKDGGPPDIGKPDAPKPDSAIPDKALPDKAPPDKTPADLPQPDASTLCGNGKLDVTEDCEGKLLGGKTCKTQGFTGGVLECKAGCTFDLRGCYTQKATQNIAKDAIYNKPVVAAGSTNYLVTWATPHKLYGAIVSQGGKPGPAFLIYDMGGKASGIGVASHGTGYLATWSHLGAMVTHSGTVKWPVFSSKVSQQRAAVFDGTSYLVVAPFGGAIAVSKITATGTVTSLPVLSTNPKTIGTTAIDLAFDGTNHLVVWNDTTKAAVHGLFVDKAGSAVGKTFQVEGGGGVGKQYRPRIAYGGGKYLVVWQDARNGNDDVIGALVNPTPKLGSKQVAQQTIKVAAEKTLYEQTPDVVYTGQRFLVVWSIKKIYAAQVKLTKGGAQVVHHKGFKIAPTSSTSCYFPVLAAGGGAVLAVWTCGGASGPHVRTALLTFGK